MLNQLGETTRAGLRGIARGAIRAGEPLRGPATKRLNRAFNRPIGALERHSSLHPLGAWERLRGHDRLAGAVAGKTVMVTGSSSGIGEAAALRIAAAGATVLLVARSADKLEALREQIEAAGGSAFVYPCDLAEGHDSAAMVVAVLERHGAPDVLINNAGRSIRRSIENSYDRLHDFERTMELNYFGALRLILGFLPQMRQRGSGQIINISSASVQTRTPRFSGYVASKAALDAFSDAVQAESLGEGIRFTTISMPLVRTPMIAPTGIYRRFPSMATDEAALLIAEAIVYRPRRLAPPFAYAASFADAINPNLMDSVRNRGYRMFPESGRREDT